jgi:hypothetical protein
MLEITNTKLEINNIVIQIFSKKKINKKRITCFFFAFLASLRDTIGAKSKN